MRRRISFTVEKNRVLVPVGEPCPFGCRYCYTRGGEVGLSRVEMADILTPFQQFADKTAFETIQFGYDGDPFAHPEHGLAMLKQLATMGRHVNFSTKALLNDATLDALSQIQHSMEKAGTTLSALVSLSCWDSAPWVEPHTPSPRERILTVTNLKRIGLPVFIAVRPVLPHIPDGEYERIAEESIRAGCSGLILGPLYADARGQFVRFIPPTTLATIKSKRGTVPWSAHAPTWTRYEDTERLQRLLLMIERKGGHTFLSSADAMAAIQQKEEVA
ncbi:MAG TPA: radical SAM protein [Ktedonosporobacter sp.]|nr:radical SAM protein [Ktedonosporobacter sp.]